MNMPDDEWQRWRKSLEDATASAALNKLHLERVTLERDKAKAAERAAIVELVRDVAEEKRGNQRLVEAHALEDVAGLIEERGT